MNTTPVRVKYRQGRQTNIWTFDVPHEGDQPTAPDVNRHVHSTLAAVDRRRSALVRAVKGSNEVEILGWSAI